MTLIYNVAIQLFVAMCDLGCNTEPFTVRHRPPFQVSVSHWVAGTTAEGLHPHNHTWLILYVCTQPNVHSFIYHTLWPARVHKSGLWTKNYCSAVTFYIPLNNFRSYLKRQELASCALLLLQWSPGGSDGKGNPQTNLFALSAGFVKQNIAKRSPLCSFTSSQIIVIICYSHSSLGELSRHPEQRVGRKERNRPIHHANTWLLLKT